MSSIREQFREFISGLSWSHPTWDLFIVVFLVVGTLLYGFSLGRNRIVMIMVALYMALVSVMYFPLVTLQTGDVLLTHGFVIKISTFLGLFAVLFFMLTRSALNHMMIGENTFGRWWHIIILSFLQVGMLISVVMSFLPPAWILHVSELTRITFVSAWGKFVWVVLPIVGLTIVGISSQRDYMGPRFER